MNPCVVAALSFKVDGLFFSLKIKWIDV